MYGGFVSSYRSNSLLTGLIKVCVMPSTAVKLLKLFLLTRLFWNCQSWGKLLYDFIVFSPTQTVQINCNDRKRMCEVWSKRIPQRSRNWGILQRVIAAEIIHWCVKWQHTMNTEKLQGRKTHMMVVASRRVYP